MPEGYHVIQSSADEVIGLTFHSFRARSDVDITSSIQSFPGISTPTLDPGEKIAIRVRINVDDTMPPGVLGTARITVVSDTNNSIRDTVAMWVQRKVNLVN